MTIKYLRDTLFVSHGVSFENKGTYELPEEACKELNATFVGYFELPKVITKEVAKETPKPAKEAKEPTKK